MSIEEITLVPGQTKNVTATVTEEMTARSMKSGVLPVLATPMMAALMEQAAAELAENYLPDDLTSVGMAINIYHTSPTPVGLGVRVEAIVAQANGRHISFELRAWDDTGEIGHGTHERYIVDKEKFLQKANNKTGNQSISSKISCTSTKKSS